LEERLRCLATAPDSTRTVPGREPSWNWNL